MNPQDSIHWSNFVEWCNKNDIDLNGHINHWGIYWNCFFAGVESQIEHYDPGTNLE